jgi:T5SS/PEP-CTERM-associated repeat protein
MNKPTLHLRHSSRVAGLARQLPKPLPLCLAIATLCSAGLADARDLVWIGGNKAPGDPVGSARMSFNSNWKGQNVQPAAGDILHFGNTSSLDVVNDLGYRIYDKIVFEADAGKYIFNGANNNIGLTNGLVNLSSNLQTLNWGSAGFVISANQTWDGGTAGMTITGGMDQQRDLTLNNKVAYKQLAATAIGYAANSTVTLTINSGSSHSTGAEVTVGGVNPSSSGIINVRGKDSSFIVGTDLKLGDVGSGTLLIDSGASASSKRLFMGRSGGAKLTVDGADSSFSVVDAAYNNSDIIVSGGGKFTATGNMGPDNSSPGFVPNESSTVTVKDKDTLLKVNLGFYLSTRGNGLLQISNGAGVDVGGGLVIGNAGSDGFGVVEVSGLKSNVTAKNVNANAGLLNISNGAVFQVTDRMTIGQAGDSSFMAAVGGSESRLSVANALDVGSTGAGRLDILGGGLVDAGQMVIGNLGVVNLQGGTLRVASLGLGGALNWEAGTLNFKGNIKSSDIAFLGGAPLITAGKTLKGDGEIRVSPGYSLGLSGGNLQALSFVIDAQGAATVSSFSNLSAANISNQGSLTLAGGRIEGALLNNAEMLGSGTIAGAGGFRNNGYFEQTGFLELSNSGSNENTGSWNLQKGKTLTLWDSTLRNGGTMNFDAAKVEAAGPKGGSFVNAAGGTITGNGSISAPFQNDGRLIVQGGSFALAYTLKNNGQILLNSIDASVTGNTVTNSGRIEGLGQISNSINNLGTINAKGGTLTLSSVLSNTASGIVSASRDATIYAAKGMTPNAGKIQLSGGTLDNGGFALTNELGGTISGYGDIRSGLLTNKGLVLMSGGVSAVYSEVVANAGSQIILSGNSNTTFYDKVEVKNGAELRVSEGSVATFAAEVKQRNGADVNGDGKMFYEGGLSIGNSPGYGYIQGTVTFASSNTYTAEIGGINACTALSCAEGSPLLDSSFDKLVVGGNLKLGGKLVLSSWNGFVAQAGQSFDLLDWGTSSGTFKSIDANGFMLAAGTRLDYSQLYSSGTISVTAVPEPESYALMLAGLGLLAWRKRFGASA